MLGWRRIGAWVACLGMIAAVAVTQTGCEDSGGSSHDFGNNDPELVVALGDSITYGYQLPSSQSYPAQLAAMTGRPVINSGINGERSEGGLSRVNGILRSRQPGYLLILYGANDINKGVGTERIVENLRGIVQAAKANQTIPVIGTVTPTFPWHDYMNGAIEALNPRIRQMASEEGARLANSYDALNDQSYYQSDGLHHNADGARRLAEAFKSRL